jgi:hypothetical protein
LCAKCVRFDFARSIANEIEATGWTFDLRDRAAKSSKAPEEILDAGDLVRLRVP